ncbi:MAG: hypothetical protein IKR73_03425 [Oscillospiraceae bacterium]|nr:hypothetical protein [Oscillospiraceae bacterium]
MIIDLDETDITDRIADTIVTAIMETEKIFRKIAFVGVDKHLRRTFDRIKSKGIMVGYFSDYEKAKEWSFTYRPY